MHLSEELAIKGQEPKRRRGHIRVAAIMDAGVELFSEKSYDAVTMTEIAARSGTAIASLYRFFPSKEVLADALLQKYVEYALDQLTQLRGRAKEMTVHGIADAFIDFSLALQAKRRFASNLAEVRGANENIRNRFRQALRDAVSAILREVFPVLPEAKAALMAIIVMNVVKSVALVCEEKETLQPALMSETRNLIRAYLVSVFDEYRDGTGNIN